MFELNLKITHGIAFVIYPKEIWDKSINWVSENTSWNPKLYGFMTKNWVIGFVKG